MVDRRIGRPHMGQVGNISVEGSIVTEWMEAVDALTVGPLNPPSAQDDKRQQVTVQRRQEGDTPDGGPVPRGPAAAPIDVLLAKWEEWAKLHQGGKIRVQRMVNEVRAALDGTPREGE